MQTDKFPREHLIVQSALTGMYGIVFLLAVFHHLFQSDFYSWDLSKYFYLFVVVGGLVHLFGIFFAEYFKKDKRLWGLTLGIDIVLISALLIKTNLSSSIFLFFYFLVIFISGLFFQYQGAAMAALGCSIGLTLSTLMGPDLKSVSYFFYLIINNILFFLIAGLSAYLSEQLELQGITLGAVRKLNQSMVDNLPIGLMMINPEGQILRSNPTAGAIFGETNLERKNIFTVFPTAKDLFLNAFKINQLVNKELPFSNASENLILRTRIIPQNEGFDKNHLLVVEDLTRVRQMELAVRQSEKLAAVGQLAAGIAHEIRNPLTGISGSIELLSQGSETVEDKKLKKIIMKEIDRLNNLITEFLDYSKPEKVPVDPVNVSQLIEDILKSDVYKSQLPESLQVQMDIEENLKIRGDKDKIKQAFLNIFVNSVQALSGVASPQIKVRVRKVNQIVDLAVVDNGCGMTDAVKSRMFEPFMTTKPKGTGLGLAMTHKIIQMHNAQIFVDSEVGRGTEIHVHFPLLEN